MQANNTTSQALILFDPKVNAKAPSKAFDLDTEATSILQTKRHPSVSESEHAEEQHRQLRYLAEVARLTNFGVSEKTARTYSLGEITRQVDELARKLHEMEEETTADASNLLATHQTNLLTSANSDSQLESYEDKELTNKQRKEKLHKRLKRETRTEIQEFHRTKGKDDEVKPTKPLHEAHSNTFVELDGKKFSFHEVAGAYLGQETRALKDATETKQAADNKSVKEDQLPEVKLRELAKAFFVTMPKEFLAALLSVMDIEHNETKVLKLRDELLNNKFRPLKESFMRLLDNHSKNLNWDSIIKIFRNEMKKKKWKDGKIQDSSPITKGISQNFISRLESTWKNQGHLTSKPTEVAI